MKKIAVISVIVIILAGGAYFLFFNKQSEQYSFRFEKIQKGDINVMVTATGTLSAVTTVQVGSQVSGTISKLYADFNSVVKSGEIVAQIDPTFLEQAVRDGEANLDRATAQYNDAKRNLDRIGTLLEKRLETQQNYDAALTAFESNKATVKSAQSQLERAKINLAYATIYAPVNGVVIDRKVDIGQTVSASMSAPTLFTIANDLSKMQVQATIDESDIGKITIGQDATFSVDAYSDEKFTGKISQIRLAPAVVQNVVNYTVIIDVSNDDLKLMPGMTANVKISTAKKSNVLKVPNLALRFQPPTELIDTVKLKEMQDAFRKRASGMEGGIKDTTKSGREGDQKSPQIAENNRDKGQGRGDMQKGSMPPSTGNPNENRSGNPGEMRSGNMGFGMFPEGIDRERFKKIRDSIQNAHGGNLSREDMMQEMQKAFKKIAQKKTQPPAQLTADKSVITKRGSYEIIQKYPQYQKNSQVTTPMGRSRLWIMNAQGKLEPIFVRTGLNDGQMTEIITENIAEGAQVVVGAFSNSASAQNQQTRNPLTGQGGQQQQFMGGGGRR